MSKRMAPLGAALAVGLCLAARETRLYTAVYNYPGLTLEAMLLNVAVCALLFAAAFPLLRREGTGRPLVALFAALTLLQASGYIEELPGKRFRALVRFDNAPE